MKKFLSIIAVFTALMCFAGDAQAGLNFGISFDGGRRYSDHCDYGYRNRQVSYYDAPRYYRPRRRAVYYSAPSYYTQRRYYRDSYRHCDY